MTTTPPTPTNLLHLSYEGNFQLDCVATVLGCRIVKDPAVDDGGKADDGTTDGVNEVAVELQLDATTMHPQGGGQPSDVGTVSYIDVGSEDNVGEAASVARIERVTIDRETGIVTHAGKIATGAVSSFEVGRKVRVSVDPDRRRILSECHTAGHVIDSAMARCERVMPPTKGYHFLEGPYVEYRGSVPPEEREGLLKDLQAAFADLVDEDIKTNIETLPRDEADALCNRLAQNFNISDFTDGDEVRVVTVAGWPCPCGGTHVKSTVELRERRWGVRGIKSKKGVVRVKYGPVESATK